MQTELTLIIILVGLLVFLAHGFTALFERSRLPDVIWLVLIGALAGPVLGYIRPEHFGKVGPVLTVVTLVVILFEGGLGFDLKVLRKALPGTLELTALGFTLTMLAVGGAVLWLTGLGPYRALTLGAILGGTSSVIVIPMVRKMRMSNQTRATLALESALGDVLGIVVALVFLESHKAQELSVQGLLLSTAPSFLLSGLAGTAGGVLWALMLTWVKRLRHAGFTTPAFVFILYGLVQLAGLSGAIAALAFGISLGNIELLRIPVMDRVLPKEPVELAPAEKAFLAEVAFLLKTFFFVYIGLSIPILSGYPMVIGGMLTLLIFLVRIPVVGFSVRRATPVRDAALMSVIVPRGLVPVVLASAPLLLEVSGGDTIRNIAYATVLLSLLLSSALIFLMDRTAVGKVYRWFFRGLTRLPAFGTGVENGEVPPDRAVTVIIPALNEEETIHRVVRLAKNSPGVTQVIVVDDKSLDATVERAKQAGATVITSTQLGKGASMRDGLLMAKTGIVVYLDADIPSYATDTIEKLTEPILNDEADFVKAVFTREAGRVTELVAKPLLSLLHPEALKFSQPLGGIIAGRRGSFEAVVFENNYGVDIGLLLDMMRQGVRIQEVNIGAITHKMKQWHELGRMSREVAHTILKRSRPTLDSLETISLIRDQMEFAVKESVRGLKKLILFDMDNTLLVGRFIEHAAETLNFKKQLSGIVDHNSEPYIVTKSIARCLQGVNVAQILQITDGIPLVSDAIEVVAELKRRGYIVGIISDSYDTVVQHIKNNVGADFGLANELEFSGSVATGELKIPSFFLRGEGARCAHAICKTHALQNLQRKYGIALQNMIAVGDSESDVCMVRNAGIGVSFCSAHPILNAVADYRIESRSFKPLLEFAE